jgi:hypothetical protein
MEKFISSAMPFAWYWVTTLGRPLNAPAAFILIVAKSSESNAQTGRVKPSLSVWPSRLRGTMAQIVREPAASHTGNTKYIKTAIVSWLVFMRYD